MDEKQYETGWGADTSISMPKPPPAAVEIGMGTFGISNFGLVHNITLADLEDLLPTYGPEKGAD